MAEQYEFTIEYYFMKFHTGKLDDRIWRTGTVCAPNVSQAIYKIKTIDESFICTRSITFTPKGE